MSHEPDRSRRRFLQIAGTTTAVAVAGCSGGDGADGDGDGGPTATGTPAGDEVPSAYETATSLGGTARDPDSLSTKAAVDYRNEPSDGDRCSGCTFYVEDRNGDGLGACAIVEGNVDPDAYCVSYAPYEGA
jgi:hypothetical protein